MWYFNWPHSRTRPFFISLLGTYMRTGDRTLKRQGAIVYVLPSKSCLNLTLQASSHASIYPSDLQRYQRNLLSTVQGTSILIAKINPTSKGCILFELSPSKLKTPSPMYSKSCNASKPTWKP